IDLIACDAGPVKSRLDRDPAEFRAAEAAQRPQQPPDRRSGTTDNYRFAHGCNDTDVRPTTAPPRREDDVLARIDHVGIACRNLDAGAGCYEARCGLTVVRRETKPERGGREAMLVATDAPAGASYAQLPEPIGPHTPVGRFIEPRGEGVHHVGYG